MEPNSNPPHKVGNTPVACFSLFFSPRHLLPEDLRLENYADFFVVIGYFPRSPRRRCKIEFRRGNLCTSTPIFGGLLTEVFRLLDRDRDLLIRRPPRHELTFKLNMVLSGETDIRKHRDVPACFHREPTRAKAHLFCNSGNDQPAK